VLLFNHQSPGAARSAVEREMLDFLLLEPAPRPRPAAVPGDELRRWAGYYRCLTPQYALFAFATELLGGVRLTVEGDKVLEHGFPRRNARWTPLSRDAFCRDGESISSRFLAITDQGKRALITPAGYFEDASWTAAVVRRAVFFGALAVLTCALPAAAVRVCESLCIDEHRGGRSCAVASGDRASLHNESQLRHNHAWALPLVAAVSLFLLVVLLIRTPQRWGQRNASTVAASALTWVFASASIAGLLWARDVYSIAPSIAGTLLTLWFWRAGWIGIRLWRF
jgi:hypothetical protein